ncbi:hypothetical protein ACWGJV_39390, partial [Streptomyces tendae]
GILSAIGKGRVGPAAARSKTPSAGVAPARHEVRCVALIAMAASRSFAGAVAVLAGSVADGPLGAGGGITIHVLHRAPRR